MKRPHRRRPQGDWLTPFGGRVFDKFFDGSHPLHHSFFFPSDDFVPHVQITEDEQMFQIMVDVHGFSAKDIKIDIESNGISLSGKIESSSQEETKGSFHYEQSAKTFYRKIPLSPSADLLKVKRKFQNGALLITVPKVNNSKQDREELEEEG